MTRMEALELCYFISANIPNQTMDPQTHKVWHEHLVDIPVGVGRQAVTQLVRVRPYVALCDILSIVQRMRTTTRRAIRRDARERGVVVNVDTMADAAIAGGLVDFSGIDLMSAETQDERFYRQQVARLLPDGRKEIGA